MRRLAVVLGATLSASGLAFAQTPPATYLDQGSDWTDTTRSQFYSQDQGSQLIPLTWLRALKAPDGQPFLWDKLARYGYIPNEFRTSPVDPGRDLPIGFTLSTFGNQLTVGMTCSACHTRNINVGTQTYRVDGGPAITDFQQLLVDLVDAVGGLTTDEAKFQSFATLVLGANPSPELVAQLRADVAAWYARENAMRNGAFSTPNIWGMGRLDAISMIFDRLTGIDLAVPPAVSIPENILPANAPTRYPFVWNAPKQTMIQWPGFAPNGSEFFGLIRNTGEVYGVFGQLRPEIGKSIIPFFGQVVKEWNSSANWPGLVKAEELVMDIGQPAWPLSFELGARQDRADRVQGAMRLVP